MRRAASLFTSRKTMSLVIIALIALVATSAWAQVVTSDFEDGLDNWTGFAGANVAVSTNQANTGTHSLLTTNRSQTYQGPSIDLTQALTAGQPYIFKVAVRLAEGFAGPDTVNMTMRSTVNGSQTYTTVATGTVTDTGWVVLQGSFAPAASGLTDLLLYIEDDTNASASYYIDTFSVTATSGGCSVPPDNSGFSSNFEDGTADGWVSRGGGSPVVLTPTQADAHSGAWSLLVTGRTATWNGPTHDISGKMCNGSQYWIEVWVKMAPGQPDTSMNLSLQLTDQFGNNSYPGVTNATVTSGGWVRLKAKPYTFSGTYSTLQIYVQSNDNPDASFYIDDVSVTYMPPPVIENITPIKQVYANDFLVGFAAGQQDIIGPHGQLAALHYNSVTPGNDLKWDTTEPTEGNFNFGPADNILAFAQAHNIQMRGHNFVWHNQVPAWVFQDANGVDMSTEPFSEANKELLLSRLKNHITTLINHYQDKIYVWDVVNEAIDESQPDGFRRSKWYIITTDPNNNPGYPEYMDDAFIYARQALDALGIPREKVKLCYNDYNTTIPNKRTFIYNWLQGAIARGVPIDCIGNQFHNTINFPIDDQGSAASKQSVIDTINLFSGLISTAKVPIINEVTEFDMSLYRYGQCSQKFYFDYDDLLANDTTDLINQGYRYRDYFQIFKNMHDKIDSVTIWGLGDDDSWLNPSTNTAGCSGINANDSPLPFDAYLQHKYAYTGIVDPLDLPGADLATTVTANSSTILSGQNVTYTITVTNNGHDSAANVSLTDVLPGGTVFESLTPASGWTCTTPAVGSNGTVNCTVASMSDGTVAPFTLVAMVACPTPNGTQITNTASVTSTTLDPNPTPNTTASVAINVSNPPPVITGLSATPSALWPPFNQLVPVRLWYTVSDNCDTSIVPLVTVSSNERPERHEWWPDWKVINPRLVLLRAERSGEDRNGLVYTITVTAADSAGYSTSSSVNVAVPHDHHDDHGGH
ncbi:MAG TPA: endo-1,4-beta-xylanase [Terriglobales bacterium]|nr:endo-1,4-beta-xylanase [Terriglobales bacterium]